MRELIAALPARLRDPFLLHYYAGFGIKEIAALLKRPEGTIKADLYHARARLKEALAEREGRQPGDGRAEGRGRAMRADDEHDPLDRWLNQQVTAAAAAAGDVRADHPAGARGASCASSR